MLSEALHVYARMLSTVLSMSGPALIAAVAFGVAVRAFAEALTHQVAGRPLAVSRRRNTTASWAEVLLMLVIGAACYGWMSFRLARAYVSTLPTEQQSTAVMVVLLTVALMFVYYKAVRSQRSHYLAYRSVTNFRVWIRGIPVNGLNAAHEYYFVGWRLRAISEVFSTVLFYSFAYALVAGAPKLPADKPLGRRDWILIGAGFAALMTVSLVRRVLVRIWRVLRPEYALADLCTKPVSRGEQTHEEKTTRFTIYRPGEWRGQDHEDSFKIANLLEWSVRRAQGRHAEHHQEELVLAARRLAQSLRLKALEISGEASETVSAYEERKFLALQLSTSREPLKFTSRIAELTADDPEPPELPRQRAARLVESISGGINVHWPTLKTMGIIIALVWLIWSGKFMDAVGLLK